MRRDDGAHERRLLALEHAELVRYAGEEMARLRAERGEHLVREHGHLLERRRPMVGGGQRDVLPGVEVGDEADDRRHGADARAQALAPRRRQARRALAEELELLARLAARL